MWMTPADTVCVCMRACVCLCMSTCACVHLCVHTCVSVSIRACLHLSGVLRVCMCVSGILCVHVSVCAYLWICVHICVWGFPCARVRVPVSVPCRGRAGRGRVRAGPLCPELERGEGAGRGRKGWEDTDLAHGKGWTLGARQGPVSLPTRPPTESRSRGRQPQCTLRPGTPAVHCCQGRRWAATVAGCRVGPSPSGSVGRL